jgi:ParB-like chromosome segregation protein Spo0J
VKLQYCSPKSLIPYNKNPRDNRGAIEAVKVSIQEFGFNQPIVTDKGKVIIVGHTRREAAIELGMSKVPYMIADHLTKAKVKAYRIADNRTNENSFWLEVELAEELISIAPGLRKATAFTDDELENILGEVEEAVPVKGKIEFSEELLESRNYVVLYFDNDVDWLSAKTHFNLRSVYSKRCNGKPWSKGIGRVIDGAKYLRRITKHGKGKNR